jgi:hypothetical protein
MNDVQNFNPILVEPVENEEILKPGDPPYADIRQSSAGEVVPATHFWIFFKQSKGFFGCFDKSDRGIWRVL